MKNNKQSKTDKIKELVMARIKTMPFNIGISMGNSNYNREQLLEHIEKEDEVGQQITKVQISFLQDLASGVLYAKL